MTTNAIHIGLAIDKKLQEIKMSKTEFGRRIGIPQQNVNRIIERETIDTGKLAKISDALHFNFFSLYCDDHKVIHTEGDMSPASNSGHINVTVGDAVLVEKEKSLERENELLKQRLADKEEIIAMLKEQLSAHRR